MKKKKLTEVDVVNWWLEKYHNTNTDEVLKLHPEWADGNHHREFYEAYQVTQEQHDEWHKWMILAIMKSYSVSKKYAEKNSWAVFLNTAPMIITSKPKNGHDRGGSCC